MKALSVQQPHAGGSFPSCERGFNPLRPLQFAFSR